MTGGSVVKRPCWELPLLRGKRLSRFLVPPTVVERRRNSHVIQMSIPAPEMTEQREQRLGWMPMKCFLLHHSRQEVVQQMMLQLWMANSWYKRHQSTWGYNCILTTWAHHILGNLWEGSAFYIKATNKNFPASVSLLPCENGRPDLLVIMNTDSSPWASNLWTDMFSWGEGVSLCGVLASKPNGLSWKSPGT